MLLKDHEVPFYAREDSITTGYRKSLTYKGCISSLFWLHNETVNIWSHLVGFAYFFLLFVWTLWTPPAHVEEPVELVPVLLQLLSYQLCMLSSTLFHTFNCHSEDAHRSWLQLDHLGILMALFGSYVSFIYDAFYCHPNWRLLHLGVIVVGFAAVGVLKYSSKFTSDRYTRIKLHLFLVLGTYAAVPVAHWVVLNGGWEQDIVQSKLYSLLSTYSLAAIGLVFYVTRFPEKIFNTGSVDLVGASHQVWHVMIFLGMVSWYASVSTRHPDHKCVAASDDVTAASPAVNDLQLSLDLDLDTTALSHILLKPSAVAIYILEILSFW